MDLGAATRCGAASVMLAAAIVLGTAGCGQSGSQAGTAPSTSAGPSTAAAAPSATAAPSTAGSPSTDAAPTAGTEAPAAGEDGTGAKLRIDPTDGNVDGPQIARNISTELVRIVGRAPASLTCPDLPAKVDAAVTCQLTDSGESYDVAVNVTSVKGADVSFTFRVADQAS